MKRKCKHCGQMYDTSSGIQAACPSNPNRERDLARHQKRHKPRWVSITCLKLS